MPSTKCLSPCQKFLLALEFLTGISGRGRVFIWMSFSHTCLKLTFEISRHSGSPTLSPTASHRSLSWPGAVPLMSRHHPLRQVMHLSETKGSLTNYRRAHYKEMVDLACTSFRLFLYVNDVMDQRPLPLMSATMPSILPQCMCEWTMHCQGITMDLVTCLLDRVAFNTPMAVPILQIITREPLIGQVV